MTDLLCIELSLFPAVSSKIYNDNRRLPIFLEQEDRFLPNASYFAQVQKIVGEEERMQTLEIIFEAVCQDSSRNDVYQLSVNLLDRYLSYHTVHSEQDLRASAAACTMIAMKIRRAREECISYRHLCAHFSLVSEDVIKVKEKEIATQLKWNINAVTSSDFIEELAQRLHPLIDSQQTLDKLLKHSLALANICLLYHSFMSVPPSLLASACLCDSIAHLAKEQYSKCTEKLSQLAGVELDVLVQHQHNVSDVYNRKIQSFSSQPNTPTNIEDIEEKEFGSRQSVS
ncbi:hypothetical protein EMCRGX_G025707 [Ephydatia muelleri]|uniref:G1/S-specific cyclin D n=1 Tax=Ephydatia muelleri TaxID=6052 RepID=A0A0U2GSF4_EPHMU|nr:G1/S-specific cyclin D [Ephydatia muelleri]|eukprot:Em0021g487a